MRVVPPKEFKLRSDLFETDICVYICSDVGRTIKRAAKLGHVLTDEQFTNIGGLFVTTGTKAPMILLPQFSQSKLGFSIAMHEIYHAVDYLCRYNGIVFSEDTEEVRARMFSHLASQFFSHFVKGAK